MNGANRTAIVLLASLLIVAMAMLIFVTWSVTEDTIDRLGDFVEYLAAHDDDSGKLIVTLGALMTAVIGLLIIIIELAPEDVERELKVQQGGMTTIVPAEALRLRLEEALLALPVVSAATARVATKDKGIAVAMDVTVPPGTNVGHITQDASRVALDTIERDLGLPTAGKPTVRVVFGEAPAVAPTAPAAPVSDPQASSWSQPPAEVPHADPVVTSDAPSSGPSWSPPPLHPEAPEEDQRPENPF